MKRFSWCIVFLAAGLALASLSVLAVPDSYLQYQNAAASTGTVHGIQTLYTNASVPFTVVIPAGNVWQPLVSDLDSNGINEMIMTSGSVVYLFQTTLVNTTLTTVNVGAITLPGTVTGQPVVWTTSDAGSPVILIPTSNNTIMGYTWHMNLSGDLDSGFHLFTEVSIGSPGVMDGIQCAGAACYGQYHFPIGDGGVVRINADGTSATSPGLHYMNGEKAGAVPAINANLGYSQIMMPCDPNLNGLFGVCALRSDTLSFDTTFNTVGYIDDLTDSDAQINNVVSIPYGGSGLEQWIVSYMTTGTCNSLASKKIPHIVAYNRAGTSIWSRVGTSGIPSSNITSCGTASGTQPNYLSQPTVTLINNHLDLCFAQDHDFGSASSSNLIVGCLDPTTNGGVVTSNSLAQEAVAPRTDYFGSLFYNKVTNTLAISSMNPNYDSYLVGPLVFNVSQPSMPIKANFTSTFTGTASLSAADIAGTNAKDLLTSTTSQTNELIFVGPAGIDTSPVVNNTLAYGGYAGFYTGPTCVGTTVHYSARECDGTQGAAGCDYTNDVATDQESLTTNCGDNLGNTVGSFSLNNPSVDCTYTTTGSFPVTLYLQDDHNPFDFSQYNTQSIIANVVNGIPGQTCNIPANFISTYNNIPGSSGTGTIQGTNQQAQAVNDLVGVLSGSNSVIKFILGWVLLIIIVYSMIQALPGKVAVGIQFLMAFACMILNTLLTLWPIWITILMTVVGVLCLVAYIFIRPQPGGV